MFYLHHKTTTERLLLGAIFIASVFIATQLILHGTLAFADGIAIGGTDNSGQMKDVQNLITTIQRVAFNWVAKIIGGFLVIAGIYKIASRDFMNGILATIGGGALFFVEKIADSLSKMSGNG